MSAEKEELFEKYRHGLTKMASRDAFHAWFAENVEKYHLVADEDDLLQEMMALLWDMFQKPLPDAQFLNNAVYRYLPLRAIRSLIRKCRTISIPIHATYDERFFTAVDLTQTESLHPYLARYNHIDDGVYEDDPQMPFSDAWNPYDDDFYRDLDARDNLELVMSVLRARERQCLILRYGLDGNEPMTLGEVGEAMGITRERVRQIEKKALRRLRNPTLCVKLRGYLSE